MTDVDSLFLSTMRLIYDSYNTMEQFNPILNLTLDSLTDLEKLDLTSRIAGVVKRIKFQGDIHVIPVVKSIVIKKVLTSVHLNEDYFNLLCALKRELSELEGSEK